MTLGAFKDVTIILPVINETYSLQRTVGTILGTCADSDISEFVMVVCKRTISEALAVCDQIHARIGKKCRMHVQKLPFIGGAMREAFDLARGSHSLMMSTDLETDPALVQDFIRLSKQNPRAIITASRWMKGGGFEGYNPVKLAANYLFQRMLSLLYRTDLTDLTYGFRIFPTELLQSIAWEGLKHPFYLETIIKPLRLGVRVMEIPAVWERRTEGESQNTFCRNLQYLDIAFRVRFCSRRRLLRSGNGYDFHNNCPHAQK
jgi:hypothetical protein